MASGKEHYRSATRVAWVLTWTSPVLAALHPALLLMPIGAHIARVVTPDLDISTLTLEERRLMQVNRLLGALYVTYWMPYALLMPHRHWLSHVPGVSTAIRMLYLLWPMLFVIDFVWLYPIWIGWTIIDLVHLARDNWEIK